MNVADWSYRGLIEPIRPTKPRFFEISDITSSSMHMKWWPPSHFGGGMLQSYVLSYLEPVNCETQTAGQKQKSVSTFANVCAS